MSERKTTRFAVLEAERVVKVHEREIPALKADEVLIKNGACNICTTDYGQYTGARKNLMFPMAWGHEFAGTIVDMGSDVKEFEVGEMVGIGYDNCGECEFCKKGLTSECVTLGAGRNKLSPDGYHGGFGCSEYVIKPYRSLFKLNQNMDPSEAAFVAGWNCMSGNSETSCTAGRKNSCYWCRNDGCFECIGSESRRL